MSISIKLFKSKTLKGGYHPIMISVYHRKKRKYYATGFKSKIEDWHSTSKRLILPQDTSGNTAKRAKEIVAINRELGEIEDRIKDILYRMRIEGKKFSILEFDKRYVTKKQDSNVFTFMDLRIDELKETNKLSSATIILNTKNVLTAFCDYTQKRNLDFHSIDYSFLKDFETFLLGRRKNKNTPGGVHFKMRNLRAIYNEALKRGIVTDISYYPFASQINRNGYSFSHLKSKIKPRALSQGDMDRMKAFRIKDFIDNDLDNRTMRKSIDYWNIQLAYYVFMFSYYARGINFKDISMLKADNFSAGRIEYLRAKTGGIISIQVNSNIEKILDKVKVLKSEHGNLNFTHKWDFGSYVFPILKEELKTPIQMKNRIKKVRAEVNSNLKIIAKYLKLEKANEISTYVARHTFATTLKRNQVSEVVISELLDHKDFKTTKVYLSKFANEVLDDAVLKL